MKNNTQIELKQLFGQKEKHRVQWLVLVLILCEQILSIFASRNEEKNGS